MPPKKRPNTANSSGRASTSSQQSSISDALVPPVVPSASSVAEDTETVTVVPEYNRPTLAVYNNYYVNSDDEDAEDLLSFADILAQVKGMDYSILSPWMSRGPPPEPKFEAESQYALQHILLRVNNEQRVEQWRRRYAEHSPWRLVLKVQKREVAHESLERVFRVRGD